MNTKKYKHDAEQLKSALESILTTLENEDHLLRVRCVLDVLNGRSIKDIATELDCNVRTVQIWVNTFDNNFDYEGCESLRPHKSTGRKPKLSADQTSEINRIILTKFPFEYHDFNTVYWTGDLLARVLSEIYPDDHISPRNCREYLKKADYSKQYDYPFSILDNALSRSGTDAAIKLLVLIRAGETEETVRKAYKEIISQADRIRRQTNNFPVTHEQHIMPANGDDIYDDYDDDDWE